MNKEFSIHITVAAIIEHNNKFLLVTDNTSKGLKLNQPAGHVEADESIINATIREVKEETGLDFNPEKISGIYLAKLDQHNSYLRFCFSGSITGDIDNPKPTTDDDGVIEAKWYSFEEIKNNQDKIRSPLVMQGLNDYLAGQEYPLSVLAQYADYS